MNLEWANFYNYVQTETVPSLSVCSSSPPKVATPRYLPVHHSSQVGPAAREASGPNSIMSVGITEITHAIEHAQRRGGRRYPPPVPADAKGSGDALWESLVPATWPGTG